MPICSYLAVPRRGAGPELARGLSSFPECQVVEARNRELFIVVTETEGPEEDAALRERLESLDALEALILSFGDIDPDTSQGDPLGRGTRGSRGG